MYSSNAAQTAHNYAVMAAPTDIPLTWDTIKVGMTVKCIYPNYESYYGRIATVIHFNEKIGEVKIRWNDTGVEDSSWGEASSFMEVPKAADVPLTWDTIKEKMKVKCIFRTSSGSGRNYGRTGTVVAGTPASGIEIDWDDGVPDDTSWSEPGSFAAYQPVVVDPTAPAINNHTCPNCGDNRVNKDEVKCWVCGGNLH